MASVVWLKARSEAPRHRAPGTGHGRQYKSAGQPYQQGQQHRHLYSPAQLGRGPQPDRAHLAPFIGSVWVILAPPTGTRKVGTAHRNWYASPSSHSSRVTTRHEANAH